MKINKAYGAKQIGKAAKYLKKVDLPKIDFDDLLDTLGLERKSTASTVFGGLGLFAVGLLVGSAVGMLFAPMTGSEVRETIRETGLKGVVDKSRSATPSA